jgi:hypothetical protein
LVNTPAFRFDVPGIALAERVTDSGLMNDLAYIGLTVAFFVLGGLYILFCDRL